MLASVSACVQLTSISYVRTVNDTIRKCEVKPEHLDDRLGTEQDEWTYHRPGKQLLPAEEKCKLIFFRS